LNFEKLLFISYYYSVPKLRVNASINWAYSEYKHVLANISRSRYNTPGNGNGVVTDNVAHAAGASILSLVRGVLAFLGLYHVLQLICVRFSFLGLLWSPYVIGQTIIFSCCDLFFFFYFLA